MLTKSAKLLLISMLLVCFDLPFAAPSVEAATHLTTVPTTLRDAAQTRTARKRRPRRRSRRRTPQSNTKTNTATETAKPAQNQPTIRVYNPAEDGPPPVRPTPPPGMRNP